MACRCRVPVKPRRAGGRKLTRPRLSTKLGPPLGRPAAAMQPLSAAIPPASIFSGLSPAGSRPQPPPPPPSARPSLRAERGGTAGRPRDGCQASGPRLARLRALSAVRGRPGGPQTSSFRSPLRRGTQACSLGGPRLETQTGRGRGSPPLLSPVFFFKSWALWKQRWRGAVGAGLCLLACPSGGPLAPPQPRINACATPGCDPTPSSAVPFNAQERWLCKMARLSAWCCVQGPPALPRGSCPWI